MATRLEGLIDHQRRGKWKGTMTRRRLIAMRRKRKEREISLSRLVISKKELEMKPSIEGMILEGDLTMQFGVGIGLSRCSKRDFQGCRDLDN
ncbi:hypothetical protein Syun_019242 [Stephania yunnanensis]|uniref:Uncharacterized protein n=1 Tax=Stephania yunnanensis TaxID=152371 RepID=A0AAP0IUG5_9MAGN